MTSTSTTRTRRPGVGFRVVRTARRVRLDRFPSRRRSRSTWVWLQPLSLQCSSPAQANATHASTRSPSNDCVYELLCKPCRCIGQTPCSLEHYRQTTTCVANLLYTVSVTTLPCKYLVATLIMFTAVLVYRLLLVLLERSMFGSKEKWVDICE